MAVFYVSLKHHPGNVVLFYKIVLSQQRHWRLVTHTYVDEPDKQMSIEVMQGRF